MTVSMLHHPDLQSGTPAFLQQETQKKTAREL
jgi:hypothetical protein